MRPRPPVLAGRFPGEATITWFDASPCSARGARQLVAETLSGSGVPIAVRDTAVLLVSELVTNSWMHAQSGVAVEVGIYGAGVGVAVHDESSDLPQFRARSLEEPTGRGLALVDRLSARWGVGPSDFTGGKVVWFEIPVGV